MSNNSSPRGNSNPFSAKMSSLLELSQQIAQQQQDVSDKIQQDLQRLASIQHQGINSFNTKEFLTAMGGIEIPYEPESETSESNAMDDDDDAKSDMTWTASDYEDFASMELDERPNPFDADNYDKDLSFINFNFHKWLKEFDLICIKEILIFRGLQLKDSWTMKNFEVEIISHPLIKRDIQILSQVQYMLTVFKSVKRRELTEKGIYDENDNTNDDMHETYSFMNAIAQINPPNLMSYEPLPFTFTSVPLNANK